MENYEGRIEDDTRKFLKQVVDVGKAEAVKQYASAEYDGVKDVKVTSRVYKKSGTITATGEKLLFIEFGTGLQVRDIPNELYKSAYLPGSWSEGPEGKGHWDDPNGWYYAHGRRSFGNPANKCMYYAMKQMELQAPKIAREVFK